MVWQKGSIPGDSLSQEKIDLAVHGLELTDPVWVEPLTGRVCELEKYISKDGKTVFKDIPVWDSPVFVIERDSVPVADL